MKTNKSLPDPDTPSLDDHVDSPSASWQEGVTSEVSFWRSWFTQKGGQWRSDYESRLDPTTPLRADICQYLPKGNGPVSILDVGSGPITNVGYCLNGRAVAITATDPLAEQYASLLSEANITAPVATQKADAEHLSRHFPEDHFDLVHSRNALDHAYDPLEAIRQMLRVCKKGGHVYIIVYRNEGTFELYEGLHQWNFDEHQGKVLVFSRKVARYIDEYIKQPYSFTMGFAYADPSLLKPPRATLNIVVKKQ